VSTYSHGKAALRGSLLIDDNADNIRLLCQSGWYGILFDRSWNRALETTHVAGERALSPGIS